MIWKNLEERIKQKHKTVEIHSSWLEQVEDRITELKDKIEIKEKNWRTVSQTTQDLW
jgi:phage shock protein A